MSTNSSRSWWWRSGVALLILFLVYLALPVHRVLPVCHSLMPGQPRWQSVANMSPTFRELFAEGLHMWKVPLVEIGGTLRTWPHVILTERYGNATLNVANHLSFPLANRESREAVLSGLKFGSPVRLPPELWRRLWDERDMDECDQLRIAVHLEPNEP